MIPYEDLVIALQTWRAKQGLPVGQLSGALTPPPAPAARTAPPVAPPKPAPAFEAQVEEPMDEPLEEPLDVEDGALLEETQFDGEGDYAMAFGAGVVADGESTTIGAVPQPDSTLDQGVEPPSGRHRNEEW